MSGLKQFTPPSMKGLNYNIDADLNLGASHGLYASFIQMLNNGNIYMDNSSSGTGLHGGTLSSGKGSRMIVFGADNASAGLWIVQVPNAAKNADIDVMWIDGVTDTPYLNLNSHRIAGILDPTTAQDALTFKTWATYTPTLTWTGGTPASITKAGRWVQIGKIVYYVVNIYSADSNGCTNLTITTPSTAANTGVYYGANCMERYGVAGNTWKDPGATVAANGNIISFWDFGVATDNQLIYLFITGWYEVA